ncbi:gluconokinase [Caldovatus sp. SYSU G05006]|uniref:Gluconokinase n=2 Tax=Caldovatus aquaticus TaxID=2865671 RepID=A0ABS7F3P8_9PROT|nr:gluconokinase [Caldovatus aquaticus]MBW8269451.1 gluconokinase [Caldovatus aquaticus]
MGVSGAGKSTVGPLLAAALGVPFADGDAFHPPANVAKMAAGTPLSDEDRWPWLAAIGAWLAAQEATGAVVACSALRRAYRDRLRQACPGLRFVHLAGARALIAKRLAARAGHFMPAGLLESQFATLEDPAGEPDVIPLSVVPPPEEIVRAAVAALGGEAPRG